MKYLSLKNLLWTNLTIKCCSLVIGLCLWSLLSENLTQTIALKVPICYPEGINEFHTAQTTFDITLQATRSALQFFNLNALAVHIDPKQLQQEKNTIFITEKHLLLPPNINMVDCNPRVAVVTLNA